MSRGIGTTGCGFALSLALPMSAVAGLALSIPHSTSYPFKARRREENAFLLRISLCGWKAKICHLLHPGRLLKLHEPRFKGQEWQVGSH